MIRFIVVSDSTGETCEQIINASIAQFDVEEKVFERFSHIRDIVSLNKIFDNIKDIKNTLIFYSLVDENLIEAMKKNCDLIGITGVDVLTSSIIAIERLLGQEPKTRPGALRSLDAQYFKRVDAIDFAVRYDDGKDPRGVLSADITILGVSRTSKTPLSMYLANKNYKVANIPLVPETPVPKEIFEIPAKKIIGLTNSPEKLNLIRKSRLQALGLPPNSSYSNMDRILLELDHAHSVIKKIGCPIIDVSERAIEETADIIIRHLKKINNEI
ncbi:pyruvate, water dikinase regulatory protein [Miniphocaeibacter halophilus]|uniref:Kinase/pyrophosphorylase n=1 Tax=Miniphocaeibacter halophilus TaxID=2931922 RepID=A0AC61MQ11_9FIRM|nr:pyruvate, water dikinase regulatory protein [Miniphocaeibacter halophilus]QQK07577.1 kinase/pyrophosphorylase [Miniphocaeibacter halophilus]